jgi:hyperosmotically inducible periplasmic protein
MKTKIKWITNVALAVTISLSTGCFWIAVGGAGAAGYAIAKDERSAGTIAKDAGITASVKSKLIRDKQIKALDIDVDTHQGVVTLNGHVPNESTQSRAVKIANGVDGVHSVESRLEILNE